MGCDADNILRERIRGLFQSTHPRGVRPARISAVLIYRAVSIHAPAWGATAAYWPAGGLYQGFNPRTRVGCDVHIGLDAGNELLFQSTHPRGVRRAAPMLTSCAVGVSIHAPAWGATPAHTVLIIGYEVSIHAPAWGATLKFSELHPHPVEFQSTHPRGVRLAAMSTSTRAPLFQSTHPRGVRHVPPVPFPPRPRFNPRTRVGCDLHQSRSRDHHHRFNPRTRVGCDAGAARLCAHRGCFNPRTRVGCDCIS